MGDPNQPLSTSGLKEREAQPALPPGEIGLPPTGAAPATCSSDRWHGETDGRDSGDSFRR